jgi:hypothetical protein
VIICCRVICRRWVRCDCKASATCSHSSGKRARQTRRRSDTCSCSTALCCSARDESSLPRTRPSTLSTSSACRYVFAVFTRVLNRGAHLKRPQKQSILFSVCRRLVSASAKRPKGTLRASKCGTKAETKAFPYSRQMRPLACAGWDV